MLTFLTSALLIFGMRVVDISLSTMRILMVVRGRKALAWLFGFCQAIVYLFALRTVLTNLDNWFNLAGYAAGFATGLVMGMLLEDRLALGNIYLRIITSSHGAEIAAGLRQGGFAVTEVSASGRDGRVSLLNCSVLRKNVKDVVQIVERLDAEAFISAENIQVLQGGFWHA